jgi:hypothetical protein
LRICNELKLARKFRLVRCGISTQVSPSLSELAVEFGLACDPSNYKKIDKTSALWLLELGLKRDMAYDVEIMTTSQAVALACRFLAQFDIEGVCYYTNLEFHEPLEAWSGVNLEPMTSATFDTGVLILGNQISGCLWIEDED